jgi:hypothetical protein
MALARHMLGSRIGGDENKLSRNISSEDVDTNDFLCSVCCSEFFETKFEVGNVTKRS